MIDKPLERFENNRYEFVRDNISEIENKRFDNKKALKEYVWKTYGVRLDKVDDSGLFNDFAYIGGINEDWGYVDVDYMIGYSGVMVTGVWVCSE